MLAAFGFGLAAFLIVGPHRSRRAAALTGQPGNRDRSLPQPRLIAAALAGIGSLAYLDGWLSLALAPCAAAAAFVGIGRLEGRAERLRRAELIRSLPTCVDLVVAALHAGRPTTQALVLGAEAVGGPIRDELVRCAAIARLGGDPSDAWRVLARHRDLGRIGRALLRAETSGAPVTQVFARTAGEVRRDAASEAARRARSVAVQTAGPLGVCFLPAFIVVGVVPTIVSAFSQFSL